MLAASKTVPNPPLYGGPEATAHQTQRVVPTPENWLGVGQSLQEAGERIQTHLYAQAEEILLQLLEFAPMEGKAWHMLGRCHQIQARHSKALECFERAAFCYKNHQAGTIPLASERLARLLHDKGETEAAKVMLKRLLANKPDDAGLLAMKKEWDVAQQSTVAT